MPLPYSADDDAVGEIVDLLWRPDGPPTRQEVCRVIAQAMNRAYQSVGETVSDIMGQYRGHEPLAEAIHRLVRDHAKLTKHQPFLLRDRIANWVRCPDCEHRWIALWSPMPLVRAAEVLRNAHCPACGSVPEKITSCDGPAG